MIFVELFRLLFVLAGSSAGYEAGRTVNGSPHAPVIGLLLGAAISYVVGGAGGRFLDKGLRRAVFLFRNTPSGEIFAASIVSTTGMLMGLVVGLPVLALSRSGFALLAAAIASLVLAVLGWRLGSVKGREIVAAAGLSRILAPPRTSTPATPSWSTAPPSWTASCWCWAGAGSCPTGWSSPSSSSTTCDRPPSRPIRWSPDGPYTVSSRSRRSGGCRYRSMSPGTKCPRSTTRPSSWSHWLVGGATDRHLFDRGGRRGHPLGARRGRPPRGGSGPDPDHLPGEVLSVELIKEGRQPRQAVGYLPDGDMVVVNDAIPPPSGRHRWPWPSCRLSPPVRGCWSSPSWRLIGRPPADRPPAGRADA